MAALRGSVKISSLSAGGKEIVLAIFSAGDIFGEIAVLDGAERSADATAMTDCELLVLNRWDFLPVLEDHADLCMILLRILWRRIRQTTEQVEDVMFLHLDAGRQSIAAARRERRSACASRSFGRIARLAARARQHGGRQPREREQDLPELASPGPDRSQQGLDYDPQRGSHRAPYLRKKRASRVEFSGICRGRRTPLGGARTDSSMRRVSTVPSWRSGTESSNSSPSSGESANLSLSAGRYPSSGWSRTRQSVFGRLAGYET
jgi:CRP-like cAMP-binding protein